MMINFIWGIKSLKMVIAGHGESKTHHCWKEVDQLNGMCKQRQPLSSSLVKGKDWRKEKRMAEDEIGWMASQQMMRLR